MTASTGTLLLWGGIAGAAVFTLAGIIAFAVLRHTGKVLLRAIEQEYQ